MLLNKAILFMSVEQLLAQGSGCHGPMVTSHFSALCRHREELAKSVPLTGSLCLIRRTRLKKSQAGHKH
jgi:hypothetical protein